MKRRTFIQSGTLGLASLLGPAWSSACGSQKDLKDGKDEKDGKGQKDTHQSPSPPPLSPIGCFNRAWSQWTLDDALDGVAAAGYKFIGLMSGHRGEAIASSAATPEYLDALKVRIARRGLVVNMTAARFRTDAALEANVAELRQQIENTAKLEAKYLLTLGVDDPAHYDNFYRLMAQSAAFAESRGVQIVLKPHGGVSATSVEIQRCLDKVAHPNFKVWYDAGNIIYYTGKDPLAELEPIAQHVTGFCAKDCPAPKGEVMAQFGTGKVDFSALFTKLKSVAFQGPIMVEGVKVGGTAKETTANSLANRVFLEKVLSMAVGKRQ